MRTEQQIRAELDALESRALIGTGSALDATEAAVLIALRWVLDTGTVPEGACRTVRKAVRGDAW